MSNEKKDLTRIEDLGDFLHELQEAEGVPDWNNENASTWEESPEAEAAFNLPDEAPAFTEESAEFTSSEADFPAETSPEEIPELSFEPPPLDDIVEQPEPEPEIYTEPYSAAPIPKAPAPKREDFSDVRQFAEKAVFTDTPSESNPAHSVLVSNIRFTEDADDILLVLKDLAFPADMMEQFRRQLERGTLLVPRVSEFTAVHLCHRLRRFRLELQSGPSDLIHPPKSDKEPAIGLVSRRSLGQNQHHHFRFEGETDGTRQILLSTLSHLDGHVVERYVGVASEHALLAAENVEDETDSTIHATYDELAQKLKAHALEKKANAVLGVNYQLTPLPADTSFSSQPRYKLTCTGNLVWVSRLNR